MSAHADLVTDLRSHLLTAAQQDLAKAERYVLLDHPSHWNVGDHAIWLGERELLAHAGLRASYTASMRSLDWSVVKATSKDDPILLLGGGNLGDLWPRHQAFREEVISRFPNRRIVQMPQSVWFKSRESLEKARRCFESHPDFTLYARDRRSYRFVRENFEVPTFLFPDTALWLRLDRLGHPRHDVLALIRADQESDLRGRQLLSHLTHNDWLGRGPLPMVTAAGFGQRVAARVRKRQSIPGVSRLLGASFDSLSRYHLRRGVKLLSAGRVVITDRLHAHILCLLLDIPHVALDNSYGKVHGFIDTWTSESPLVHKAATLEDAIEMANSLIRISDPQGR